MRFLLFLLLFCSFMASAQQAETYRAKKVAVKDSVALDSVSINPLYFEVFSENEKIVDTAHYSVDFVKAKIYFETEEIPQDSVLVKYLAYPDFFTRKYFELDKNLIVESNENLNRLYQLNQVQNERKFTPFEGLNSSGSISRGITVGNNQNAVLDSQLDLQISGRISESVGLRASIRDENIPLQEGGYSQNLNEFDQVFIELFSDNWSVRAGDVDLIQDESYFASFRKKVQGLLVSANLSPHQDYELNTFLSGALVKGVFTRSSFIGQEGNQGPYKLRGPNGELYVLVVPGSEVVYVNGVPIQRGENKDYIIDYAAGEIIFTPTFPITSEMRIVVEYQYSERRFNRILATGGASFKNEKLAVNTFVYSETDSKNQPLQQNLSEEQVDILQLAGDDQGEMVAASAAPASYNQNRILYEKVIVDGEEIFVYSNNAEDELYEVKFSLVGANQGNYVLANVSAIQKIYEYVAPVDGVPQGNYAPVVQLFAPTKLQVAVINGSYKPSEKTAVNFELAGSLNDENTFSDLDDQDNVGVALRLGAHQNLLEFENLWQLNGNVNLIYLQQDFTSIQRIYNVEFERDWNIINPLGNQTFFTSGLELINPERGAVQYHFQHLNFSENYNGNRQEMLSNLSFGRLKTHAHFSYLKSNSSAFHSEFFRSSLGLLYDFNKAWAGAKFTSEKNEQTAVETELLSPLSQSFRNYEVFAGIGDSTNIYTEFGYRHRTNDSIRSNVLQPVSSSNTYFIESTLIKKPQSNLSIYMNYRRLNYKEETQQDDQSFNSRLLYNQMFFDRLVQWNSVYETSSGTLAQQEFTYIEVEPGQGVYTWNDYNNNEIQELEEFEVASFQDEANFVRILLPSQVYLKTHQNKLSQIVILNFQKWNDQAGFKDFLSHFYNQTTYIINRKELREGDGFNLNPFNSTNEELGLNLSFRNSLYFNRGKNDFTTSYNYIFSETKNLRTIGLQHHILNGHQITFTHKITEDLLLNLQAEQNSSQNEVANYENQNYELEAFEINPEISFLFSENKRISVFYHFQKEKNQLPNFEELQQQKAGFAFNFANEAKFSLSGELNYIYNAFEGNPFSPVAYQMLEGLQPKRNFTWNFIAQRRLTDYLSLNFSYFGRKSENSRSIHTGSIQLKAYF